MHQTGYTFGKQEKLCSRKTTDRLFEKGDAFIAYPLRVQFIRTALPENVPAQALFSVPKKRFKRAVKRNLFKRRMREAYRLNKHQLYDVLLQNQQQIAVAFVFVAKEAIDYHTIEKGIKKAITRLIAEIEKDGNSR
jgi:ribonuclease P protein component